MADYKEYQRINQGHKVEIPVGAVKDVCVELYDMLLDQDQITGFTPTSTSADVVFDAVFYRVDHDVTDTLLPHQVVAYIRPTATGSHPIKYTIDLLSGRKFVYHFWVESTY